MNIRFAVLTSCALFSLLAASKAEAQKLKNSDTQIQNCALVGLMQGGGIVDGSTQYNGSSGVAFGSANLLGGFGELGAQYACNGWGAQVDGAFYAFSAPSVDYLTTNTTLNDPIWENRGHIGGELFRRDPGIGMLGLGLSDVLRSTSTNGPGVWQTSGDRIWRVGALGEIYLSDKITIGGGAFYLSGWNNSAGSSGVGHWTSPTNGFDADVYIKFYPADHWALSLRGDFGQLSYTDSAYNQRVTDWAATTEAEYLVSNTPASVFLGARYAHQSWINIIPGDQYMTEGDLQGYVGLRVALGAGTPRSLSDRDRNGLVDNTSVLLEKIPSGVVPYSPFN